MVLVRWIFLITFWLFYSHSRVLLLPVLTKILLHRRLRKDPIDVITLNLAICLFFTFFFYLLSSALWKAVPRPNCLALSAFHHFFLLCSFVWMAAMSFMADRCLLSPREWILWITLADESLTNKMMLK